MVLPRTFKVLRSIAGFTLVETILTLSLLSIITSGAIAFSLPAMSQFACREEGEIAEMLVERARHISQHVERGNVELKIENNRYRVVALGDDITDPLEIESVVRRSTVGSLVRSNIIFWKGFGSPVQSNAEIFIGSEGDGCQKTITINNAGAIL